MIRPPVALALPKRRFLTSVTVNVTFSKLLAVLLLMREGRHDPRAHVRDFPVCQQYL